MIIYHACRSKVLFGLGRRSEAVKHGLLPTSAPGIAHVLPAPAICPDLEQHNDAPPVEPQKHISRLADPSSRFVCSGLVHRNANNCILRGQSSNPHGDVLISDLTVGRYKALLKIGFSCRPCRDFSSRSAMGQNPSQV